MINLNLHRDCPLAYTLFVPRKMCGTCKNAVKTKECAQTVQCILERSYGLRRTLDSSCGEWKPKIGVV